VRGDGVRLAVRERGDAGLPVVVLVHGYPDDSGVWDRVAAELAGRFRVVRYDVRGCGESAAPADRAGYGLGHLAADLAAVVRAVSPDRPVHLVAHDWGSIQGWEAVTEPACAELFASYTSISGPCLDHVGLWMRAGVRRYPVRVLRQLLHSWYIGFFQLPVLPELVWRLPLGLRLFRTTARDARNGLELYRANMGQRGKAPRERRTAVAVQQLALTRDAFVLPDLLAAAEPWCASLWRRSLPVGHWAVRTHAPVIAARIAEFATHVDGGPASPELQAARRPSG
jgi:pimeloyl-ACP methyl ester carboxylesterase